jgi:hypothetical protein
MKNSITNLASAAMIVILSPVLLLAIIVSVKTAGVRENDTLLLLLTLLSAFLSGINGFGRRTTKLAINERQQRIPNGEADPHSRISWSTTRTNA